MQLARQRQGFPMRLLHNILALAPCGKPQAVHFAQVTVLPGRVNFTGLDDYGGRSARTHARWFARPLPSVRLTVTALGAVYPRDRPVGVAGPGCQLRAQVRSRDLGCGLVLERHSSRRPLRPGGKAAGVSGCQGRGCPSFLCPPVPGHRPLASGDGRRRGPVPACERQSPPAATAAEGGAGLDLGGTAAQGCVPVLSLHRSSRAV